MTGSRTRTTPVKVDTAKIRRFDDLPVSQQAGMLCNDPQFRSFVAHELRFRTQTGPVTAQAAAEHVRLRCGVNSRADLNWKANAAARFQALRTDFDAWRGRIARPDDKGPGR